uniref:Uncharacterized protein n=1 Tax=Marseillevirus LCMAC101 TaxID=2506602 RepID=A0A481YR67_9VIRU|nr:MAG: hypothetical protein LCMAC101_03580 [Marseillevirus LCMAC101]
MQVLRNKRNFQSLVSAEIPQGELVAQEVNNEWCDTNQHGGNQIYLKLTNLAGGPQGDSSLKWLDYFDDESNDVSTLTWSVDPTYNFFITPSKDTSDNRSFLLMADSKNFDISQNKWNNWKTRLCTTPDDDQRCDSTSNVHNCSIGHRQRDEKYWGTPQSYCLAQTHYADTDCVHISTDNKKRKSWWGRSPYTNGKRGPSFCNAVANVASMDNRAKHVYSFFLDGSREYPQSSPTSSSSSSCKGCTRDSQNSGTPCPSNGQTDLLNACPGPGCTGGYYGANSQYSTWISDNTAAACCSMTATAASSEICGDFAFNPGSAGSKCPSLMADYCVNNWNSCAIDEDRGECTSPSGTACNSYLTGGGGSVASVQETISGYINDPHRNPTDYISWKFKDQEGSPSYNYYKKWSCTVEPSGDFPTTGKVCDRDDSKDPFFVYTIPYLCEHTGIPGTCDAMLGYFCQEFDRDDLIADPTLLNMCGCFLLPYQQFGEATPYSKPNLVWSCQPSNRSCPTGTGANKCCWRDVEGVTPKESPYYTDANCDPVCLNTLIPSQIGYCDRPICVIDDIVVNSVNSSNGEITLTQICGTPDPDGNYGYCYIGDVTINTDKPPISVDINNNCSQCFQFTDTIANSIQIECDGSDYNPDYPGGQPDQPEEEEEEGRPWYKRWITIITVIIIAVLLVLGFGIGYYYRHKKVAVPEVEVYDPSDAYYDFDFSDYDFGNQ